MRKTIYVLLPLLLSVLSGCNSNNQPTQRDDNFFCEGPLYEEFPISREGTDIESLDVTGIPSSGIKAICWDEYDIGLRVTYKNNTVQLFKFWEKYLPIASRHYLGEVGTHSLDLLFGDTSLSFQFEIVENPEWDGSVCQFFNREGSLLDTQKVGYYQPVTYEGPELPSLEEDEDYQYRFTGWNYPTDCVFQDMQYTAVYDKTEKRYFGLKPLRNDHIGISALVDSDRKKGSILFALGRVKHVAALYTETKYLDGEDLTLNFELNDYSPYWNSVTESITSYAIDFVVNPEYNYKLYGSAAEILLHPEFASDFDPRYDYEGVGAILENGEEVKLSHYVPFETTVSGVAGYSYGGTTVSKDSKIGYYRYAVIASFDVYLNVSFNRIGKDKFEIGTLHQFIISPVLYSFKVFLQYSEDGEFKNNFDQKLTLSTAGLYAMAQAIDWGRWEE